MQRASTRRLPHTVAALAGLMLAVPAHGGELAGQQAPPRHQLDNPDATFPEPFSLIRGLRELGDGRVLVTDWIEERLGAVDFDGGTARDIGRVGGGPREFRLPAGLVALPGDSTLLVDVGNGRLAVVGPDLAIHRTMSGRPEEVRFGLTPRYADVEGRLYFTTSPWGRGPAAGPSDSVDIARWDSERHMVVSIATVNGVTRRRDQSPSMKPRFPNVPFAPQDAWAVTPEGDVFVVRSGDYHIERVTRDGKLEVGPPIEYPVLPVTHEDKFAYVLWNTLSSPIGGRGEGMTHQPAEWSEPAYIEEMIANNEFAEVKPPFVPGGAWTTPEGELWVERSMPFGEPTTYDVFDRHATRVRQVALPEGRRLLGFGRGVLYAVVEDGDGLPEAVNLKFIAITLRPTNSSCCVRRRDSSSTHRARRDRECHGRLYPASTWRALPIWRR